VHLLYKETCSVRGMLVGLTHAYVLRRMISREREQERERERLGKAADAGADADEGWLFDEVERSLRDCRAGKGKGDSEAGDSLMTPTSHAFVNELMRAQQEAGSGAERTWIVDALMLEPRRARLAVPVAVAVTASNG
jgi:hypothetical protein